MSRSLIDHQLGATTQIARRLNQAKRQQQQHRTLQKQGNQALQLTTDDSFFEMSIPTTPRTETKNFFIHADYDNQIMLANLTYSIYYPVFVGFVDSPSGYVYELRDGGDIYSDKLTFECFLAYDDRDQGTGTLAAEADVLATAVPAYAVRLTARLRSTTTWSLPSGQPNRFWVYFEIRATVAEGAS